jgi:MFS transporter, PHS family, inorganic phosphate transporter
VADPARPGRGARRRRHLPAPQDARIAPLPDPGAREGGAAASQIAAFTDGQVNGDGSGGPRHELGLRAFLTNRRWLILLAGTAGTWFLLDYAYYGNTISTPQILSLISPTASTMTKIALQLAVFVPAAVPGYLLAIARLDKIGHRRLQLLGFAVMGLCFLIIAAVPGMTTMVVPFCWCTG